MVMKIKQLRMNSNRRSRTATGPLGRKLYTEPRQHPKRAISTKRKGGRSLWGPHIPRKHAQARLGKGSKNLPSPLASASLGPKNLAFLKEELPVPSCGEMESSKEGEAGSPNFRGKHRINVIEDSSSYTQKKLRDGVSENPQALN